MKRLRVPPLMETQDTKTVFRSGLFIGIVFCLLVVISVKCNVNDSGETFLSAHDTASFLTEAWPFYVLILIVLFPQSTPPVHQFDVRVLLSHNTESQFTLDWLILLIIP